MSAGAQLRDAKRWAARLRNSLHPGGKSALDPLVRDGGVGTQRLVGGRGTIGLLLLPVHLAQGQLLGGFSLGLVRGTTQQE